MDQRTTDRIRDALTALDWDGQSLDVIEKTHIALAFEALDTDASVEDVVAMLKRVIELIDQLDSFGDAKVS
ncbi:hypothetical protein [Ruegeria arenilitoris]|uniref:Uncharacterized protein n=1 Tax=Ruegeria arenilitoris TaxID=1173585 RepID=A0A238K123_9RHOB|nr:hypothetical protein [Ruegeria arenilitoris]SMX36473.1 hypothetical protein RUA8715_01411 [Ruegeria arenilitoris]